MHKVGSTSPLAPTLLLFRLYRSPTGVQALQTAVAGREYGENIDIPVSYALHDVGRSQPVSCALSGNISLSQCISSDPLFTTQSRVVPEFQNQPLAGWFMDFHASVPLYESKLQLNVDNCAEIFDKRKEDTSFNTGTTTTSRWR